MGSRLKKYHQNLRDIGCVVCLRLGLGPTPPAIHHLFDAHQRDDWLVAPVCHHHHQGPEGFHGLGGERPFRNRYGFGEMEMLADTIRLSNEN